MTRASVLSLLAMALSAFVPAVTMTACQPPQDPCRDHADTGLGSISCWHTEHRLEVHGMVAVCRCVRPEPAVRP